MSEINNGIPFSFVNELPPPNVTDPDDFEAVWTRIREVWRAQDNALGNIHLGKNNCFSRVIGALLSADSNNVFSPSTLVCALLVLAEMATGNSKNEILEALSCDTEDTTLLYNNIIESTTGQAGVVSSSIFSSLWLNQSVPLNVDFLRQLCAQYGIDAFRGEMGTSSMDEALRDWINRHTMQLLSDYTEDVHTDSLSVFELLTTSYFKADWDAPFRESKTKPKPFYVGEGTSVLCDFMHGMERTRCHFSKLFTAAPKDLALNYQMWFLLPDEGVDLSEITRDPETIHFLSQPQANSDMLEVSFALPKFDVPSRIDLKFALNNMGICSIFDEQTADFSPVTDADRLFLSKAEHTTRVKIVEDGVEAASCVDIGAAAGCLPPNVDKMDFVLDRPFLFAITKKNQIPLYVGAITNPVYES